MRPSCNRHVLSLLRRELGMNQSDFAWLVGCSASHIQAVEIRRLALTERVAMRVFAETGVSPVWLLANDFDRPMVDKGGQAYAKSCYELAQAKKVASTTHDDTAVDEELLHTASMLWSVVSAARKKGTVPASIALFRINKFVEDLRDEFGFDFWVYDGKNRARSSTVIAEKVAQAKQRKKATRNGQGYSAPSSLVG